ncbi:HlyD family secretion protein [Xanthomonas hortorum]|uniref:HlyD family secretion protein n=1 Tax=Xanthomonas hortorum pv. hederae TaxID=453603 RepID=A0A9X4BUC0_9XANT|nr:HlyD family secretion protein [Xanthomonas hortorum]MCE4372898.1 HlyD family secretion protein [Xanthomonas hortorum pv. hederae]MDC8639781.1 HlyD family secretion protein [Xanthomonas hortorum pv. hederae]PPU78888.1 multidrug ABC transporter permease [Xanthomonas hortorum pv. hederae]PUE98276.1 HlyD family secretion protein [Xanthomonas hortorum pv. hederae]
MSNHDHQSNDGQASAQDAQGNAAHNQQEPPKPSPLKNPKVKWTLIVVGLLVVVLLALWLAYYLIKGRYMQSTNNAYLQADSVAVAPRVSGYVTKVMVGDNQIVEAGQPLLQIDDRTYQATLQQAEAAIAARQADIAAATANVSGQESSLVQARSQVTSAAASLTFAQAEVKRFAPLAASGADTHEHQESLQHELARARAQYDAAQAQAKGAQSQILASNAQLEQAQAGVKQATADADQARVAVEDTLLTSRIRGRVGDKTVQVGQFLGAGTRTMTIVPQQSLYLVANFKETQVGLMRPGQPAEIEVDALSGVKLHGKIESLSPGTGSQFALLPPENATGNFTKVVQRIPVRIRVLAGDEARKVLVPGMSVEVTVDTRSAKDAKQRAEEESDRVQAQERAR